MKRLFPIALLLLLIGCKNDPKNEKLPAETQKEEEIHLDSIRGSEKDLELRERFFNLKRRELLERVDQRKQLENLLISKSFHKEKENFVIDLSYPYLNESLKPSYSNFNDYVKEHFINVQQVEKQMEEEKNNCDAMGVPSGEQKRLVEYKVYNLNDRLMSVLFFKENHYAGAATSTYTFETLNFDLENGTFMKYEDFFNSGSEEELAEILNSLLTEKINSGEMYYDCWSISDDDFFSAKNNFVIADEAVEYYFDDCVICPSYTGTYSIKIPLEMLMPVLRQTKRNPLFN